MATFLLIIFFQNLQVITIRSSQNPIKTEKNDLITVHYQGLLEDTTEFENSFTNNQPISFHLGAGKVIKGWDTGLVGMKIGEVRKLIIPPKLAYGEKKVGPIPANSTLIFIVELLNIKKAEKPWGLIVKHKKVELNNSSFYDIELGGGVKVTNGATVKYHYNLFDKNKNKIYSSYDQNDIKKLLVGSGKHMIKGFEEALLGMQKDGKRKVICKDEYGETGDLYIFDVTLISIE
jgi:FKBP-type peptidyl-prolyl cis-trans isomerase